VLDEQLLICGRTPDLSAGLPRDPEPPRVRLGRGAHRRRKTKVGARLRRFSVEAVKASVVMKRSARLGRP
jgi:hypothetical protein